MNRFIAFLCLTVFCFTSSVIPTTINGRLIILNSDSSNFKVLLQVNTNSGTDDLGGATIVLGFDTSALHFPGYPIKNIDYVFHNFSGGTYTQSSVTKPRKNRLWVNIDLPFNNSNNGTVVAGSPQWTDVVSINFNVIDQNNVTNLFWITFSPFWGIYDADNITLWETGVFDGNFELAVEINDEWNTVSVPGINPNGQGVNDWWPGRDPSTNVFKKTDRYVLVTTTIPGEGYWMKHAGTNLYNTGDEWPLRIQMVPHHPINANAGWNLIGGFENAVSVSSLTTIPPGLITGPVFSYSNQYQIASTLEPGRGYLVYLTDPGQIIMEGLAKPDADNIEYFKKDWGKITITDNTGRKHSLYLVNDETDLNLYKLPPIPPEGAADIRFGSGGIVEDLNSIQSIEMNELKYPISISVENIMITLQDSYGKVIEPELRPGEEFTIADNTVDKLNILPVELLSPMAYTLEQNYPNPFNPVTTIKFAIPNESFVNLSIYSVLGELLLTLVNEELKSGHYEYEFNAPDFASGVYLYRIQAGDFIQTKKMILMK